MHKLLDAKSKGEIITGLIHMDPKTQDLHNILNTSDTALNQLTEKELTPSLKALEDINQSFR